MATWNDYYLCYALYPQYMGSHILISTIVGGIAFLFTRLQNSIKIYLWERYQRYFKTIFLCKRKYISKHLCTSSCSFKNCRLHFHWLEVHLCNLLQNLCLFLSLSIFVMYVVLWCDVMDYLHDKRVW